MSDLHERDVRLVAMVRAGATLAQAGAVFGLSRSRVGQITRRAGLDLWPRRRGRKHGVSGYVGGCRCGVCRLANTERMRRSKAKAGPARVHGLSGYNYHGCRCEVCRLAKRENTRRNQARLRQRRRAGSESASST